MATANAPAGPEGDSGAVAFVYLLSGGQLHSYEVKAQKDLSIGRTCMEYLRKDPRVSRDHVKVSWDASANNVRIEAQSPRGVRVTRAIRKSEIFPSEALARARFKEVLPVSQEGSEGGAKAMSKDEPFSVSPGHAVIFFLHDEPDGILTHPCMVFARPAEVPRQGAIEPLVRAAPAPASNLGTHTPMSRMSGDVALPAASPSARRSLAALLHAASPSSAAAAAGPASASAARASSPATAAEAGAAQALQADGRGNAAAGAASSAVARTTATPTSSAQPRFQLSTALDAEAMAYLASPSKPHSSAGADVAIDASGEEKNAATPLAGSRRPTRLEFVSSASGAPQPAGGRPSGTAGWQGLGLPRPFGAASLVSQHLQLGNPLRETLDAAAGACVATFSSSSSSTSSSSSSSSSSAAAAAAAAPPAAVDPFAPYRASPATHVARNARLRFTPTRDFGRASALTVASAGDTRASPHQPVLATPPRVSAGSALNGGLSQSGSPVSAAVAAAAALVATPTRRSAQAALESPPLASATSAAAAPVAPAPMLAVSDAAYDAVVAPAGAPAAPSSSRSVLASVAALRAAMNGQSSASHAKAATAQAKGRVEPTRPEDRLFAGCHCIFIAEGLAKGHADTLKRKFEEHGGTLYLPPLTPREISAIVAHGSPSEGVPASPVIGERKGVVMVIGSPLHLVSPFYVHARLLQGRAREVPRLPAWVRYHSYDFISSSICDKRLHGPTENELYAGANVALLAAPNLLSVAAQSRDAVAASVVLANAAAARAAQEQQQQRIQQQLQQHEHLLAAAAATVRPTLIGSVRHHETAADSFVEASPSKRGRTGAVQSARAANAFTGEEETAEITQSAAAVAARLAATQLPPGIDSAHRSPQIPAAGVARMHDGPSASDAIVIDDSDTGSETGAGASDFDLSDAHASDAEALLVHSARAKASPSKSPASASSHALLANRPFIEQFEQLEQFYAGKPGQDFFRNRGYRQAIEALRAWPHAIRTEADALSIPGIGKKSQDKLLEIIRSGGKQLRKLGVLEAQDDQPVLRLLRTVHGIGEATARLLYDDGVRTLEDLRVHPKVTPVQLFWLEHYAELTTRMPRVEAEGFQRLVDTALASVLHAEPRLRSLRPELLLLGSYRRGKALVGDVDILVTIEDDESKLGAEAQTEDSAEEDETATVLRLVLGELQRVQALRLDLASSLAEIPSGPAIDGGAEHYQILRQGAARHGGPVRDTPGRPCATYAGVAQLPVNTYRAMIQRLQFSLQQRGDETARTALQAEARANGYTSSATAATAAAAAASSSASSSVALPNLDALRPPHRRIDIRVYRRSERPFATLYFTGSGEFNRRMRYYASCLGFRLSDHSLIYGGPTPLRNQARGGTHERDVELKDGAILECLSEQDIFGALHLKYVAPEDRDTIPSILREPLRFIREGISEDGGVIRRRE